MIAKTISIAAILANSTYLIKRGVLRYKKEFDEKSKRKETYRRLVDEQLTVDELTLKDLTPWFKERQSKYDKMIKMVVSVPTIGAMGVCGCPFDSKIDINHNLLQMYFDCDSAKAVECRIVNFKNLAPGMRAKFAGSDGIILFKDVDL